MSSLKQWANELIIILKTAIENNPSNDPPIPQNNQPRLANNNLLNHNQLFSVPAPSNYIWPSQISRKNRPRSTPSSSMLGMN